MYPVGGWSSCSLVFGFCCELPAGRADESFRAPVAVCGRRNEVEAGGSARAFPFPLSSLTFASLLLPLLGLDGVRKNDRTGSADLGTGGIRTP